MVEWGVGKTFDSQFNMGIIGYNILQTTDQKDAKDISTGLNKYRVNGIGMEVSYRYKKWLFATRWYLDYLVVNRVEGTTIRFVLLKNF